MHRWWIINLMVGENDPYQINLLGAVIGPILGFVGALLGFIASRPAPHDAVCLGFAGLLMTLPAGLVSALVADMVVGEPIKTWAQRIAIALVTGATGSVLVVALMPKVSFADFLPWLWCGLGLGFLIGLSTQQYDYPVRKKRKKKRRREEEAFDDPDDEDDDRPRRRKPLRRRRRDDED